MSLFNSGDQLSIIRYTHYIYIAGITSVIESFIIVMPVYLYFLLTIIIELPLLLLFFKEQWKLALLTGLFLNFFTWPLLHFFVYTTSINVNMLELGVALIEAVGYRIFLQTGWKKALGVSFLLNGLSYGIGLLIHTCC